MSKLAEFNDWIVKESKKRRPVEESMAALIDYCEETVPHPDWGLFRLLPFGDLSELTKWLAKPFREQPPPSGINGLWFGLFNPCPDGKTPVADIYVSGSKRYRPDPRDNEWAVGPDWWPNARYANSTVLAEIYRIANRQGENAAARNKCLANDAEYPMCLGYGTFVVQSVLSAIEPALILNGNQAMGVSVGFDSGDWINVGSIESTGLCDFNVPADIQQEIENDERLKLAVTDAIRKVAPDCVRLYVSILPTGEVLIFGSVSTEQASEQAEAAVRSVVGNREISNNLYWE